jgi:hypothetical protein
VSLPLFFYTGQVITGQKTSLVKNSQIKAAAREDVAEGAKEGEKEQRWYRHRNGMRPRAGRQRGKDVAKRTKEGEKEKRCCRDIREILPATASASDEEEEVAATEYAAFHRWCRKNEAIESRPPLPSVVGKGHVGIIHITTTRVRWS